MNNNGGNIFSRLILLCGILSITLLNYSAAQSKNDIKNDYDPVKDEVVSKLIMQKIMAELNAYEQLKVKYSEERELLNKQLADLTQQLEEMDRRGNYRIVKLERENEKLKKMLSNAEARARGYKELAHKKSLQAIRMREYKGKYYTVLSIQVSKMILVMAPFTVVMLVAKDKL